LRRAAIAEHGTNGAWGRLLDQVPHPLRRPQPPSVSILLATRRAEYLDLALATVARQSYARTGRVELVLALHGLDLPAADVDHRLSVVREAGIDVVVLRAEPTLPLGQVLREATARASGTLLAKFDDDDWYGRDHLTDIVQASTWSGATVTGTIIEWVYLAASDRTVHRRVSNSPERFEEWVGGGTLLIRAEDLAAVGGWAPQPRGVDLHLLTAVRDAGGGIYRTTSQGYVLCRHSLGHTWEADEQKFLETATDVRPGWAPAPELNGDPLALRRYQRVRELTAREQLSEARRGDA
ncbi:MAG: glycosyltransferase, partial [Actinomycetes bacterium]